jgi:two-component system chemotaxis sensor kinase CheA
MEIDREAVIQVFLVESEELLDAMEQALIVMESRPNDSEAIATVFRAAHTLKGNAASLGFAAAAEMAHAVEDLLDRLRAGTLAVTSGLVTVLLKAVDALRALVPAAVTGTDELSAEQAEVAEHLRRATPMAVTVPAVPLRRSPGRRRSDVEAFVARATMMRVDTARLNQMLDVTGEIAISRDRLRRVVSETNSAVLTEAFEGLDRLFVDLQELVLKTRMVPVGPLFRQYGRMVRDVAVAHGKQARLEIGGEAVEVDTSVVEQLKDCLTHLVRNALDHGIEKPEARLAAGKDACGTLSLRGWHDSGNIVIELSDDGVGLDLGRIAEVARTTGRLDGDQPFTEQRAARLICEAGFSTAAEVTDLSGRGVGLDIVRRRVEALRGSITFESRPGKGLRATLRLPLTLAIISGFGVRVANETYIVPLDAVIECLDPAGNLERVTHGRGVIDLRGQPLPCVRLRDHFGLSGAAPGREQVVVVRHGERSAGLVVDAILGASQAVVKPLASTLGRQPSIGGCTILGSGRVALILDVAGLFRALFAEQGRETGSAV